MPRRSISKKQLRAIHAKYAARKVGPTAYRLEKEVDVLKDELVGVPLPLQARRRLKAIDRDADRVINIVKTQNR